jgi:peptidoglycan/xylan/chitin deacetylase (PgdA/CDA1 family)
MASPNALKPLPKMPNWKRWLLEFYYYGTLPYRAWLNAQAAAGGKAPVMVLFYHRIADDQGSPWTLSNREFAEQIRWLKNRYEMVSLAEAQRRIADRHNARPAVSITFDDGYASNCDEALPLLIAEKIPCTYFVTSRCVLEQQPFPHDVVKSCAAWPNTLEQVRAMAAAGIEIGAHTRSHADLGKLFNPQKIYEEVVVAGQELQQALGHAVRYFAFPFGHPNNLSPEAFHLAHEYGYEAVCTAYGGYNFPGDDPFHIQRIHAENLVRVKNWLTLDPRKLHRPFRYDYHSRPQSEPVGANAR